MSNFKNIFNWMALLSLVTFVAQPVLALRSTESQESGAVKVPAAPSVKAVVPAAELQKRQQAVSARRDLSVSWDESRGMPSRVHGSDLLGEGAATTGVKAAATGPGVTGTTQLKERAVAVMGKLGGMYGVKDAAQEFSSHSVVSTPNGYRHVRLNQTYQGLPVLGGQVIVHFDGKGTARSVNGAYQSVGALEVTAVRIADQARAIAQADQASMGNPVGVVAKAPQLVVFALDVAARLAWQVVVTYNNGGGVVGRWRYWVDDVTGAILLKYNDIPNAAEYPDELLGLPATITGTRLAGEGGDVVSFEGWSQDAYYYLYSFTNKWFVSNAGGYPDGWSMPDAGEFVANRVDSPDWDVAYPDPGEMSGASALENVQLYYRNRHGRDSYDDLGTIIEAKVHVDYEMVNAFWDGTSLSLGDGDGGETANSLAVVDIMGHELQHAVTEYSANLIYAQESGALNESFSDIFGFLVEYDSQPPGFTNYPGRLPGHADWLMGEDSWTTNTALRDMRNPANIATVGKGNEQPTKYRGKFWDPRGEVHQNDSVQNFFFYLLCEGGKGVNDGITYFVPPVGIPTGERFAYDTLTGYMTPSTDYAAARDAWVACAQDSDDAGTTTNAVIAVSLAWAAVGIGEVSLVFPDEPFISGRSLETGEYSLTSRTYIVINPLTNAMTWTAYAGQNWLACGPQVTIPAGESFGAVTVSVDTVVADAFPKGIYYDTINFTNTAAVWPDTRDAILHCGTNYSIRSTPFVWIDPVANRHAKLAMNSGFSPVMTMPFEMLYYDATNTSFYVSDHGFVTFGTALANPSDNTALPNWRLPNSMACPYWDAFNGSQLPSMIYYGIEGTGSNRQVVVTWASVPHLADAATRFSFQMIIEENPALELNSPIVFQYKNVAEGNLTVGDGRSATVGLEDQFGALSKQYSYNAISLANDVALRFSQNPPPDLDPPTGTVRALGQTGSNVYFEVRFDDIVTGLSASGLSLAGSTVPGIGITDVNGGGFRYIVTVSPVTGLGRIYLTLLAGAVHDFSGNPNAANGPAIYVVQPVGLNFSDDMENGPSAWTASTQVFDVITTKAWEWGVPTYYYGPVAAHSGSSCWGTVLDGDYSDNMNAWVMTAPIAVGANPVLSFYYWTDLEIDYDYGYVEVNNGNGWTNVTPLGVYGGMTFDWMNEVIPLDNERFGNRQIQVRFRVTSDLSGTYAGMYVDDVQVSSRREPGVWVVNYTPEGGLAPSSNLVTLTAYNSTTNTYSNVMGAVGSPEPGVTFSSGLPQSYGTLLPGDLMTNGASLVGVVLGAPGNFTRPIIQLTHDATTGLQLLGQQSLPFVVSNVTIAATATNVVTVKSVLPGVGVTNWLGQYLKGDGGMTSCLYQVICAGLDGVVDPPLANGQVTGDDTLLYSSSAGMPWGLFGAGGVPANQGQFSKLFNHGEGSNALIYVRAFDGPSFDASVAYGDSALYALTQQAAQSHDFGGWLVGTPLNPTRDSDGDSIADGTAILMGMDPRNPIEPLAPGWNFTSQLGSAGGSSGQFASGTPSPTRVHYKGNFIFALDTGHSKIQVWNRLTGQFVGAYGSVGTGDGQFSSPFGMGFDPRPGTNQFAVSEKGANPRIQVFQFDPATGTNITFVGKFGSSANFIAPTDVAIAPDGRFYVTALTDSDTKGVQIFSANGTYQMTLAGAGTNTGKVINPWGVTVGTNGMVVVADTGNSRLHAWNAAGTRLWTVGSFGTSSNQFKNPRDVAFGPGGLIYVADTGMSRLSIYRTNGAHVATFSDHDFSLENSMVQPYSLVPVVDSNVVYLADTLSSRILTVTTIFDGDGDGMDDVWEILHGLNPNDPSDAAGDYNVNGITNIGEYRLQQDPGEGPALLRITAFSVNPSLLSWEEVASGEVYRVEYSLDHVTLATNSWQHGVTVTSGVAGILTWTNSLPMTNGVEYFRVIRE